jgi:NitT/TauT family transport system permease protein
VDHEITGDLHMTEYKLVKSPSEKAVDSPSVAGHVTARGRSLPQRVRAVRIPGYVIGIVSVAIFFAAWQLVGTFGHFSRVTLPTPAQVIESFGSYVSSGAIWPDLSASGEEIGIGYALATIVAIPLGLLCGWYRWIGASASPYISFFYSVPIVALSPLIVIWFGIGLDSKIIIIFLAALFPILLNTMSSVRNLDPALVRAARSFCASDLQLFRTVALPGSLPFIITGMKLAIGHAIVAVYVGELVAAQHGVGLMMDTAGATYDTPRVFVGLMVFGITGVTASRLLGLAESRLSAWK